MLSLFVNILMLCDSNYNGRVIHKLIAKSGATTEL